MIREPENLARKRAMVAKWFKGKKPYTVDEIKKVPAKTFKALQQCRKICPHHD
jgi:hypothetical protein